jgi:hypothetical protein
MMGYSEIKKIRKQVDHPIERRIIGASEEIFSMFYGEDADYV